MSKQPNLLNHLVLPTVAGMTLGGLTNRILSLKYKTMKKELGKHILLGGLGGAGVGTSMYGLRKLRNDWGDDHIVGMPVEQFAPENQ